MKISSKRLAANRANAQRSTGPKTSAGKRASSGNAHRHGVSTLVSFDADMPPRYEALALALASGRPHAICAARDAAELRYNLDRIEAVRLLMLKTETARVAALSGPRSLENLEIQAVIDLAAALNKLEGYSRRIRSRFRKTMRACDEG
jgi:hypothetical protein